MTTPGRRAGGVRRGGRVVISSLTGKPMQWDDDATEGVKGTGERARRRPDRPIIPDRLAEDTPDPGEDESNDARLAQDVPPHWDRGA